MRNFIAVHPCPVGSVDVHVFAIQHLKHQLHIYIENGVFARAKWAPQKQTKNANVSLLYHLYNKLFRVQTRHFVVSLSVVDQNQRHEIH